MGWTGRLAAGHSGSGMGLAPPPLARFAELRSNGRGYPNSGKPGMAGDIYQTPDSSLERPAAATAHPDRAVVYGILVAIGGTFVGALLFGIVYGIYLAGAGISSEDMQAALDGFSFFSPVGALMLVMVLPLSLLAGCVCSRKSVTNVYRDTMILCLVAWIIGKLIGGAEEIPLAEEVASLLVSVAVTFAGAWLGKRKYASAEAAA